MKTVYSIGFSEKSAEDFFKLLEDVKVTKIVDIRRNNKSQLAGFAKSKDLKYFLMKIANIKYEHILDLAPPDELLKKYQKDKNWNYYEIKFNGILTNKDLKTIFEKIIDKNEVVCLLCSENKPINCHRRLVLEYIKNNIQDIDIIHLVK
ncbi:MAG: DUF488 domain-containing protein [Candidatus Methanofastidiosum sp.]|nr:DUF488 domain-containing protein [Methanofastidiosum sp.]